MKPSRLGRFDRGSGNQCPQATHGLTRLGRLAFGFSLVLAVAAGWGLGAGWLEFRETSMSAELAGELPEFDSFSRPEIAAAVLEQEARRAYSDCVDAREIQWQRNVHLSKCSPRVLRSSIVPCADNTNAAARLRAAEASLQRLQARVALVKLNLDREMLAVCENHRRQNEFVDRYLVFLREAPSLEVILWAGCALNAAEQCGRKDELVGALQQEARFRPEARDRADLQRNLGQLGVLKTELADEK